MSYVEESANLRPYGDAIANQGNSSSEDPMEQPANRRSYMGTKEEMQQIYPHFPKIS